MRDCGFVPSCPSCATSLTYHEDGAKLVCHHCGYSVPVPPKCPECGSPYLKKFGAGTQRVEADLRALLDAMPEAGFCLSVEDGFMSGSFPPDRPDTVRFFRLFAS